MSDLVTSMASFHRNEGIVIGRAEGRAEGREEERKANEQRLREAARQMSVDGLPKNQIARWLALDPATVDAWLREERP